MTEKKDKQQGGTVKMALGPASWIIDRFDPSIEGVPVLTSEYQDVPADKEEAVRDAAKANNLTLGVKKGA